VRRWRSPFKRKRSIEIKKGRAGSYTNSPDNISHKNKIDLFYLAILKIVRNISLKYSNNVG